MLKAGVILFRNFVKTFINLFCMAVKLHVALLIGITYIFFNAATSFADDSTAQGKDAKELFQSGKALFESQQYDDAAKAFRQAYELKPAWKLLYNIAQAEAAANRYGPALTAFEKYLALGGEELPYTRSEAVLMEIRRLRELVGSIDLNAPEGAVVFVDEIQRGIAPLSGRLRVTASVDHLLVVQLGKNILLTRTLRVGSGEVVFVEASRRENLAPVQPADVQSTDVQPVHILNDSMDATPAAAETQIPSDSKSPMKKLSLAGWITAGAGVAFISAGAVLGIKALSINNDLKEKCKINPKCASENDDQLATQNAFAITSTVFFGVGVGAATIGTLLLFRAKKRTESPVRQAHVIPMFHPEFTGAIWQRSF